MRLPTQEEVDCLAHFVEASRELRKCPFFIEEFRNISISWRGEFSGKNVTGSFPEPSHVSAMLIPFRRLWQKREPCHFGRVANILKKYLSEQRSLIDFVLFSDRTASAASIPFLQGVSVPPSVVVDMWINTRYMHTGKSARQGQHTRDDFEDHEQRMGKVLFEFYFLSAVHEIGLCFLNLQGWCERLLATCASKSLHPSFSFRLDDASPPASIPAISRQTPGFGIPEDTPATRLWRLCRRQRYNGMAGFLGLLGYSHEQISEHMSKAPSFDALVQSLGLNVVQEADVAALNTDEIDLLKVAFDPHEVVCKTGRLRKGFGARRRDGTLVWYGDYAAILSDQYSEMRSLLLRQSFE